MAYLSIIRHNTYYIPVDRVKLAEPSQAKILRAFSRLGKMALVWQTELFRLKLVRYLAHDHSALSEAGASGLKEAVQRTDLNSFNSTGTIEGWRDFCDKHQMKIRLIENVHEYAIS